MTGSGRVAFSAASRRDLTLLTPIEYLGSYLTECDYSEGYGVVAHDYLDGDRGSGVR